MHKPVWFYGLRLFKGFQEVELECLLDAREANYFSPLCTPYWCKSEQEAELPTSLSSLSIDHIVQFGYLL